MPTWTNEFPDPGGAPPYGFIYSPGSRLYLALDIANSRVVSSDGRGTWQVDNSALPAGFLSTIGAGAYGWSDQRDNIIIGGDVDYTTLQPFVRWIDGQWQQATVTITAPAGISPTAYAVTAIGGTGAGDIWAAGAFQYVSGMLTLIGACVFRSTDGGATWVMTPLALPIDPTSAATQTSAPGAYIQDLFVVGPNAAWAVGSDLSTGGSNFIFRLSQDGWEKVYDVAGTASQKVTGVWASGSDNVWFAFDYFDGVHASYLLRTLDEGESFDQISPSQWTVGKHAVYERNPGGTVAGDMWIATQDGPLLLSTDGGTTWVDQSVPAPGSLDKAFLANYEKVVVASNGNLYAFNRFSAPPTPPTPVSLPESFPEDESLGPLQAETPDTTTTDITVGNQNADNKRFGLVWGDDGDVSFDATEAHAVVTSVMEDGNAYWADDTHGTRIHEARSLTNATPGQIEAEGLAGVVPLETANMITGVQMAATGKKSDGRVVLDMHWTTPTGQVEAKKVEV